MFGIVAHCLHVRRNALVKRCDQQNAWFLAGDPRGIYGNSIHWVRAWNVEAGKPPHPTPVLDGVKVDFGGNRVALSTDRKLNQDQVDELTLAWHASATKRTPSVDWIEFERGW